MNSDPASTDALLQRTRAGDQDALQALLTINLDWVRQRVRERLGPLLRQRGQTDDYLQDVVVDLLRNGPRFVVRDQERFRALLCRIVENVLTDRWHFLHRQCRSVDREQPLAEDPVIDLDLPSAGGTRPSEAAARAEEREWIHLAMELLPAMDRRVLWLREWEGQAFPAIAATMAIAEDAARMRFARALQRLGQKLELLRAGRLGEALAEDPADAPGTGPTGG
jgi:RNA polymerase sigma-70 factor (ECF subfamily)